MIDSAKSASKAILLGMAITLFIDIIFCFVFPSRRASVQYNNFIVKVLREAIELLKDTVQMHVLPADATVELKVRNHRDNIKAMSSNLGFFEGIARAEYRFYSSKGAKLTRVSNAVRDLATAVLVASAKAIPLKKLENLEDMMQSKEKLVDIAKVDVIMSDCEDLCNEIESIVELFETGKSNTVKPVDSQSLLLQNVQCKIYPE